MQTGQIHDELSRFYDEEVRLLTFNAWPVSFIRPEHLAKAGFYFTGSAFFVRCAFCMGYVGLWRDGEIPEIVHRRLFPNCSFVQGYETRNKPLDNDERRQHLLQQLSRPSIELAVQDTDENTTAFDRFDRYDETGIQIERRYSLQINSKDDIKGVVPHTGPTNVTYATLDSRLKTFQDWPALCQQPQELAEAGFYYNGCSDKVRCFYCDGGLYNWQPKDIPWVEHARWFSKCAFVRLFKGDKFISDSSSGVLQDSIELKEKTLQAVMNLDIVRETLALGISPTRVQMILREKWDSIESKYSSSQQQLTPNALNVQQCQEKEETFKNAVTCNLLELEQENQRLKTEHSCKICMDKDIGVAFLPCGHLISCLACVLALTICPLCRQPITATVKTYMS